jgi:hypothetical protein
MTKDLYDGQRFDGACPTCGQHFLREEIARLFAQIDEDDAVMRQQRIRIWELKQIIKGEKPK